MSKMNLSAVSADELMWIQLPPLKEYVRGLVVQGLTVIAAPQKTGKSWFVLDLCFSIATGKPFLGFRTEKADCLYLALEDGIRRLQDRSRKVLNGERVPENVFFATESPKTDTGLTTQLDQFVRDHPKTGLIVVDTLQKIRGTSWGREGTYATDYRRPGQRR